MFSGFVGPKIESTFFMQTTRNQTDGMFYFSTLSGIYGSFNPPITESYFSLIKFVQPGLLQGLFYLILNNNKKKTITKY
jgi:hypothetical protein